MPGTTPSAYPGWESASETSGESGRPETHHPEVPEPPTPPSRYEQPGPGYEQPRYGEAQQAGQPYGGPGVPPSGIDPSQQPHAGTPYPAPPGAPAYPYPTPYPAYPDEERRSSGKLGTAALVLGIVAILSLVVCGFGVLVAVVGLIIGIVALAKRSAPGRAWVGIVLSLLTLVIAAVFLSWVYSKVGDCMNLPPELQRRCIEDRFGVQVRPAP
ncbi:DUF4190 domain-containing protein [Streptosporangium sp. NPDC000563]|uniref:DUF4190 domain-containing protein n=1 Tax=Streptosporangium sp. NPDC000563 TaxID=3154366 RepID=UPI00331E1393